MKRVDALVIIMMVWLSAFGEALEAGRDTVARNGATVSGVVWPRITAEGRGAACFSSIRDDILESILDMSSARRSRLAGSLHLSYSFMFDPASPQGRFYPGAYQGIGASVTSFGHREGIGSPVTVYLLQGAPFWHIAPGLTLGYEWNFGASMGWKPSDGNVAYSNLIVGSRVNAYIDLSLMLQWRMGRHWLLGAGLEVTHYSNGNTSYPNPGVNTAGLRAGVSYLFGRQPERSVGYLPDSVHSLRRISCDITAYGAWRKRVYRELQQPLLLKGHYAVAGFSVAPMYEICRIFRAGGAVDCQWDQSTSMGSNGIADADAIELSRPSFFRQVSVGISARAELVMPFVSVNGGIGVNILGPHESKHTYEMMNLKIYMTPGFYVNVGYQLLDFQRQNNLMLGIGYTLGSNRRRDLCVFR